ncbi:MAG: NADH-quinone oxidoreductase subunit K [Candidatus Aerophobetes bacterium]|nr:NADH-quinone oxidoreductase subunit K [Candidatus Aerophobetes bacterium]
MNLIYNWMYYISSGGLILIGMYIVLVKTNLIKIIIGLHFIDTGINILLICIGYVKGRTAPIFSTSGINPTNVVDPVPQALVLTAIVIGVAVLALALSIAIKVYEHNKTLNVSKIKRLKW